MDPEPDGRSHPLVIGPRLRAARRARGLTIEQLADITNLSKGYLSRLERDRSTPSLDSLVTICRKLSISVAALLESPDAELVRHEEAHQSVVRGNGYIEHVMTPRQMERVQVLRTTADPGASSGEELLPVDCAVEVLHVVAGTIDIVFASGPVRLHAGDSLTFKGREPHRWANADDEAGAELLWVLVPGPWAGEELR